VRLEDPVDLLESGPLAPLQALVEPLEGRVHRRPEDHVRGLGEARQPVDVLELVLEGAGEVQGDLADRDRLRQPGHFAPSFWSATSSSMYWEAWAFVISDSDRILK